MQAQGLTAASVRGRVFPLLRQTHPMLPRVRSIWFRDYGQDLWTMSKRSCTCKVSEGACWMAAHCGTVPTLKQA